MNNQITRPISPDPILGNNRSAQLENFVILSNLEMVQQIRVSTLGADGVSLRDKILNSETLTPEQKEQYLAQYGDRIVTRHTADCFVNELGELVPADTEGAITQAQFFQQITIGNLKAKGLTISDDTPVMSIVYALLGEEIGKIDERGGL